MDLDRCFPKKSFLLKLLFPFVGGGLLCLTASAGVDPVKLFNAHEIYGVGGNFDFVESSYSVLSHIVSAKAAYFNSDSAPDVILVSDGSMAQASYAALPPTSYLYLAGVDIDNLATYDVSPNVWMGSNNGGSPNFSFSAWGMANKRGTPPTHSTFRGSDLAWLDNDGHGFFRLRFIAPGGRPAWVYGAKQIMVGDLDPGMMFPRPDAVVFSDHGPTDTNLGDSSVMAYKFQAGTGLFTESVVSKRGDAHAQQTPRAGYLASLNGDAALDILVGNHDNSPYLYWYKNDGSGNFLSSDFQPVIAPDADVDNPSVLWAGNFTDDALADILVGRDGAGGSGRLTLLQGADPNGQIYSVKHMSPVQWKVRALAVSDINGDGRKDVVAGMEPSSSMHPSPITIFFSDAGFNTWTSQPLPHGGDFVGALLDLQIADLNHDSKLDVMALFSDSGPSDTAYRLRGLSSNVHVWINRNVGGSTDQWDDFGLAEPALPAASLGSTGGNLVVADFDGDGDPDILRVGTHCPAVLFENVWNTERQFRIRATTGRGRNSQATTTLIGVSPLGNRGNPIAETTGNQ